jgi:DNA helicase-2/ATP-dependent DNA helicase PcrA
MSDASVAAALRSNARLVVIESPAGCGKTYQGAEFARDAAPLMGRGRILVLAHTHAACDVFASRTPGLGGRVDIRTIDSLIVQIAAVYHSPLRLPPDVGAWARERKDGYRELAEKVAGLLRFSPMIARSLALRYPIIVCDEHQDANADQEAIVLACHDVGASVRVFGDPMQRIFGSKKKADIEADTKRWERLQGRSERFEKLDRPHRWSNGSERLGYWILAAREPLRAGGRVDLRGPLPVGVSVLFAENQAPRHGAYLLTSGEGRPIRRLVDDRDSILVLSAHNSTVDAMRAFLGRRVPIWEGHVRDGLSALVKSLESYAGDAEKITEAAIGFMQYVSKGFSPSAYGNSLLAEVRNGCVARRRLMPAKLQALGRIFLEEPNHRGAARFLLSVEALARSDSDFAQVELDCHHEFWDAVRLKEFENPSEGFAEISRRRSSMRQSVPAKALSTIHKAKGLECDNVLIIPCDADHFGDTHAARCNLYVAMSRASNSLTIVVSRKKPSPLVVF